MRIFRKIDRKIAVKPNGVTMGKAWSRSEIGDSHEKLVECPMANYRIPFVQNYASDARYSTEYDRKSHRGNRVLAWLRSRSEIAINRFNSPRIESSVNVYERNLFLLINSIPFLSTLSSSVSLSLPLFLYIFLFLLPVSPFFSFCFYLNLLS